MDIVKNEWRNAYYFWLSQRGCPIKVKPIKYIGLRGWDNYIYRKDFNGIIYCGEIWLCEDIFGDQAEYTFRIAYSDDIEERKYTERYKVSHPIEGPIVEINAHTDGLEAYITKDFKRRNTTLLDKKNEELEERIELLKRMFKEEPNPVFKLGIQKYLLRLETPSLNTYNEWKKFSREQQEAKAIIINTIKGYGITI